MLDVQDIVKQNCIHKIQKNDKIGLGDDPVSDNLKANKALKWLSLSGVLAFVAVFCEDLIGSMNYPGYNWMGRAVSDLTALDSPSRVIAAGFFGASAMLGALFGGVVVVYFSSRANRLFRIGTYLSLIGAW